MIGSIRTNDKVKLKDGRVCTVYKLSKYNNIGSFIYGLGLDPKHPGNYEWYYENGKPVTYWANNEPLRILNENKTVVGIIR